MCRESLTTLLLIHCKGKKIRDRGKFVFQLCVGDIHTAGDMSDGSSFQLCVRRGIRKSE